MGIFVSLLLNASNLLPHNLCLALLTLFMLLKVRENVCMVFLS